eukprot:TRINITY_DN421_c1_g1_i1.p1 TRINITY_DN421_c1_g1~~TRINITY_DN421_c1_g1_i1.p1  ORF type:complete len:195 (+),score=47.73 TRINITY_DN421_c1_g1_i1:24-608(+)
MRKRSSSCFSFHNLFVSENGDVHTFGRNNKSQLGNGNENHSKIPIKIMNNQRIREISLGTEYSMLIELNGDLYGCGDNQYSQLGIPSGTGMRYPTFTFITSEVRQMCTNNSATFIQKFNGKVYWCGYWEGLNIESNGGLGGFQEIKMEDVTSFSCGYEHCLFLKENGEVWAMGSNTNGQCGFEENVKKLFEPKF